MKRILIIGTGSIGERHLRCFQSLGGVEVAACEPNAELGRTIAQRYGCGWFGSLDEALAQGPFDAAVVCTPAHTHIALAAQCVEAGLHVLIEKPLATSTDGVEALQSLAAKRGAILRVAYVYRSLTPILALRKRLQSGVIGEPKHVTFVGGQHFPTFRPVYRTIYYARHETGGGAIQDALTHGLHGVAWLVGPIETVFADARHQVLDGVEVEDTVNVIARLRGGVSASFALNQFQAPNENFLSVHGPKGSLRVEFRAQRVGQYLFGRDDWEWEILPAEDRDGPFIRQARSFIATLDGANEELATLSDGLQTLRVNLAALESSRTRCEITL